ncbi:hypothetical protein EYC80_003942 [Monilinia laxa]|uniref:L-serine ammonia-lyase n=1 Tax=Monilinia laxa TaxID=61186 RepID=A0A5N6KL82_MONLA|nr:hypothetical protein EYC80_003942 [Monilinia laxa]
MGSITPTTDGRVEGAISKPWIRTPLVRSATLSRVAGCNVWLKLDNLQPSGSFKSRGIGNFLLRSLPASPTAPSTSTAPPAATPASPAPTPPSP